MTASNTYCVTGANGYIGSCLVQLLLRRGYYVHATLRDLGKGHELWCFDASSERLKVFESKLEEEGS
ncbi:hypothetical protein AMTRI_Chr02g259990 [Amborella trichopoda]